MKKILATTIAALAITASLAAPAEAKDTSWGKPQHKDTSWG